MSGADRRAEAVFEAVCDLVSGGAELGEFGVSVLAQPCGIEDRPVFDIKVEKAREFERAALAGRRQGNNEIEG